MIRDERLAQPQISPLSTEHNIVDIRDSNVAAGELLTQVDQECFGDVNARMVNYALLLGLGARTSRLAYIPPEAGAKPTTPELFGVRTHQIYHNLLKQLLVSGEDLHDEEVVPDPVLEKLHGYTHAMYRLAQSQSPSFQLPMQFDRGLAWVVNRKLEYFEGRSKLNDRHKAVLLFYDKAIRAASEMVFIRTAEPFCEAQTHLPSNFIKPQILLEFCDPTYWLSEDTLLSDNKTRVGYRLPNKEMLARITEEYHYLNDQRLPQLEMAAVGSVALGRNLSNL